MSHGRSLLSLIAAEEAPRREGQKAINPLIILILAIPMSALYVLRVLTTGDSIFWSFAGYVATGLAFGLLQSLFYIRRRYLIAFLSTASIPLIAYVVIGSIMILYGLNILLFGEDVLGGLGGYGIEIVQIPLNERVGRGLGVILFALVLSALVIPFGLIGIGGRFLGDELAPRLAGRLMPKFYRTWSAPNVQYLSRLNRLMADHFSLEDIEGLCFELGIDHEDIPGEAKAAKIRELLIYVSNRDLVLKLVERVQAHRPDLALPDYPAGQRAGEVQPDTLRQQFAHFEKAATRGVVYVVLSLATLLAVLGVTIATLPAMPV